MANEHAWMKPTDANLSDGIDGVSSTAETSADTQATQAAALADAASEENSTVEVFVSYAREDQSACVELVDHLSLLVRQGLIRTWHDMMIRPGTDWNTEIHNRMQIADIVILLISKSFLASDFCYGIELKLAMERHERRETLVVPILLSPCDLTAAPFMKLQALPTDAKPISTWANKDEAWAVVVAKLRSVVSELQASSTKSVTARRRDPTMPTGPQTLRSSPAPSKPGLFVRIGALILMVLFGTLLARSNLFGASTSLQSVASAAPSASGSEPLSGTAFAASAPTASTPPPQDVKRRLLSFKTIDRGSLRWGLQLGFQLGRFELIDGAPFEEARAAAPGIRKDISDLLKRDGFVSVQGKTGRQIMAGVVREYGIRDAEKHAAILIGIASNRALLVGASKVDDHNVEMKKLALSAVMEADPSVILDRPAFFEALFNSRPKNVPELLQLVDEHNEGVTVGAP